MIPVVVLLLVLSALPGMAASDSQALPNVLLITVDTLRADHLSSYGYHLRTSPNIDKLASEGVRFENAHTVIPQTGPAHISLLSSSYPQEHGARINGLAYDDEARIIFLQQVLRKFGYATAAFVSAWPLSSRLTHLDRYFDIYEEDLFRQYQMVQTMRWAGDVTPRALSFLRTRDEQRPFFMWVHYFDPHQPYETRVKFTHPEEIGKRGPVDPNMKSRAAHERVMQYDSEIGYTDYWIGRLLKDLDRLKIRDNTIVVFVADHGESLGEHDYVGHGRHLYEPIVRIPLIVRYPGKVAAGRVVKQDVSLVDITPTILDLTVKQVEPELELPVEMSGRSLAASLGGDGELEEQMVRYVTFAGKKGFLPKFLSDIFVHIGGMPMKMGHAIGPRKVIWTPGDKKLEIYDVKVDPLELKPSRPKPGSPQYKTETARLQRWFDRTAGAAGENKMTEEDIKALKSLGYLQ